MFSSGSVLGKSLAPLGYRLRLLVIHAFEAGLSHEGV